MKNDWRGELREYLDNCTSTDLTSIAITKGHMFSQEYDKNSGRVVDRQGYHYLKEGYVAGFLAGVAFRMSGGHDGET